MSLTLWIELAALALAIWAAHITIPRPPALDWERLLKVTLATLIRAEIEAADGDQQAWKERLARLVPYHPAGRHPEQKLATPSLDAIPAPALPLERKLVEQLTKLSDASQRWREMYIDDPAVDEALLSDPGELGEAYAPARVLSPQSDWDSVADWDPEVVAALKRRWAHVVFVGYGISWTDALQRAVPGARLVDLSTDLKEEALCDALDAPLQSPADRLVIISQGPHTRAALDALCASAGLRDRLLAMISAGGALATEPDEIAWLDEHFRHEVLNTELNRTIAYSALVDVDPAAPLARPWGPQRFPDPPEPVKGFTTIDAIDLGPLPLAHIPEDLLARALWIFLAFRLAQG